MADGKFQRGKRQRACLKSPFVVGADVRRLKFEGFWHKLEPPHVGSYIFKTRSKGTEGTERTGSARREAEGVLEKQKAEIWK